MTDDQVDTLLRDLTSQVSVDEAATARLCQRVNSRIRTTGRPRRSLAVAMVVTGVAAVTTGTLVVHSTSRETATQWPSVRALMQPSMLVHLKRTPVRGEDNTQSEYWSLQAADGSRWVRFVNTLPSPSGAGLPGRGTVLSEIVATWASDGTLVRLVGWGPGSPGNLSLVGGDSAAIVPDLAARIVRAYDAGDLRNSGVDAARSPVLTGRMARPPVPGSSCRTYRITVDRTTALPTRIVNFDSCTGVTLVEVDDLAADVAPVTNANVGLLAMGPHHASTATRSSGSGLLTPVDVAEAESIARLVPAIGRPAADTAVQARLMDTAVRLAKNNQATGAIGESIVAPAVQVRALLASSKLHGFDAPAEERVALVVLRGRFLWYARRRMKGAPTPTGRSLVIVGSADGRKVISWRVDGGDGPVLTELGTPVRFPAAP
jgi:hypothetical protein